MKKFRNVIYLILLFFVATFTACSDDNDVKNTTKPGQLPEHATYILNGGRTKSNNANLTIYDADSDKEPIYEAFLTQNKRNLGDTGQSIIKVNQNLYIIMSYSKILVRTDLKGKELNRVSFTKEEGEPRYLVYSKGKLYVTTYGQKVMRLDATTLAKEANVEVGMNPERIILNDGKLYVANSGWGKDNRVSEVDLENFSLIQNIEVTPNPHSLEFVNGDLYLISWRFTEEGYDFQKVSVSDNSYTKTSLGVATHMAKYKNTVYLLNSETDWSAKTTVNTFFSYNTVTKQMNSESFLKNAPKELMGKAINVFKINPNNGDFYFGTNNFSEYGDIFHFDAEGNFIRKIDAGGYIPNDIAFTK